MIGKENIVKYFIESHKEGSNISRVCVSRDKVGSQSDHEDYVWVLVRSNDWQGEHRKVFYRESQRG